MLARLPGKGRAHAPSGAAPPPGDGARRLQRDATPAEQTARHIDDTERGVTKDQRKEVEATLMPYPPKINAALGTPPNIKLARQLVAGFAATGQRFLQGHNLNSRAKAILAGAAGRLAQADSMLAVLTATHDEVLGGIEGRLKNAEMELKKPSTYSRDQFDRDMEEAKRQGTRFKDEATFRQQFGPLEDAERERLVLTVAAPVTSVRSRVEQKTVDLHTVRDDTSHAATACSGLLGSAHAGGEIMGNLQQANQHVQEASRMIDAAVGPLTTTIATVRQLVNEVSGDLHALTALPPALDPTKPDDPDTRPTRLPPGYQPPAPVDVHPE